MPIPHILCLVYTLNYIANNLKYVVMMAFIFIKRGS